MGQGCDFLESPKVVLQGHRRPRVVCAPGFTRMSRNGGLLVMLVKGQQTVWGSPGGSRLTQNSLG